MEKKILVETSARHVHLTQETIETLFGKGHVKLTRISFFDVELAFAVAYKYKLRHISLDSLK